MPHPLGDAPEQPVPMLGSDVEIPDMASKLRSFGIWRRQVQITPEFGLSLAYFEHGDVSIPQTKQGSPKVQGTTAHLDPIGQGIQSPPHLSP